MLFLLTFAAPLVAAEPAWQPFPVDWNRPADFSGRLLGKNTRKNLGTWTDIPARYEQELTELYNHLVPRDRAPLSSARRLSTSLMRRSWNLANPPIAVAGSFGHNEPQE